MIALELDGGVKVTVRPKSLHSYIEKTDYIKSRRPSPYSSLRDIPKMNADAKKVFVEIAMMASMKMSSVPIDEELHFDSSFEGFYYAVWQSLRGCMKWSDDGIVGVDQAEQWYSKLSDESKDKVRLAIRGVDERTLAKNSDGPDENPQKGPEQPTVVTAGRKRKQAGRTVT